MAHLITSYERAREQISLCLHSNFWYMLTPTHGDKYCRRLLSSDCDYITFSMLATIWQENCFDRTDTPLPPIGYHYANAPASSVDAIRKAVFTKFDLSTCIFIVRAKLWFQAHLSSYNSRRYYAWERRPSCDGHMAHLASPRLLPRSAQLFHPCYIP